MSSCKLTARHDRDGLAAFARPLVDAALAAASGNPVPDDMLPQAALGLSLQACINATVDLAAPKGRDVVAAFATAFAAWATGVATDEAELEDAIAALSAGVRQSGPIMFADRRRG